MKEQSKKRSRTGNLDYAETIRCALNSNRIILKKQQSVCEYLIKIGNEGKEIKNRNNFHELREGNITPHPVR